MNLNRLKKGILNTITRAHVASRIYGFPGLLRTLIEYHLLRKTDAPIFILPNGLKMLYPHKWREAIGSTINEVFIAREYSRLKDFEPNEDDIIVDAGAFVGAYTLYVAKRASKVIALEPSPLRVLLKYNVKLNKLGNVVVLPYALLDVHGFVEFYFDLKGPTGSSVFREGGVDRMLIRVPTITLDILADKLSIKEIDILKMDIEGSECKAFKGAQRLLDEGKIDRIVLEIHPYLCRERELVSLLTVFGYKVIYRLNLGKTSILYVRSPC
jgi:FkbM family methyltransferase